MIKIGLVGEDPNDTLSIKNLLLKRYKGKVTFYALAKGIKGYQLDNAKIKKALPIEFKSKGCRFIIYIRDLDGFKSEQSKVNERQKWFNELNIVTKSNGLLLLNIWELEALILADIETFNKLYKIKHAFNKDPVFVKDPKELLMRITGKSGKKYQESHCPDIFDKLNFDVVTNRCQYFKDFIYDFDTKLASK